MKMSKRFFSLLLALLMLLSLFPATALAEEPGEFVPTGDESSPIGPSEDAATDALPPDGDKPQSIIASGECGDFGMYWKLDDQGTLTISGSREMRDFYSYPNPWGDYRQQIVSVVVLSGPTSIGSNAFENCRNLRSVSLPGTMERIGKSAFANCSNLTEITIPVGVTTLAESCFSGCSSLGSVTLPETAVSIEAHSFSGCAALTQLVLPSGLTEIPDGMLSSTGLTSILLPEGVVDIGNAAFANCSQLGSICFPEGLNHIGFHAFLDCKALTEIEFTGSRFTSFGAGCFNGVTATAYYPAWDPSWSVYPSTGGTIQWIPKSNAEPDALIASGTFGEDLSWTIRGDATLTISGTGSTPNYSMGDHTPWYDYRVSIKAVVIEPNVTSIGSCMFRGSTWLRTVTIPDTVTEIGRLAFSRCYHLEELNIPDSVTALGENAFQDCGSLKRVTIPDSLTAIDMQTFQGCAALEEVLLPPHMLSLGYQAFADCPSLREITIPAGVTEIAGACFNGCTGLQTIWFLGSAPSLRSSFMGVTATAYYPADDPSWTEEARANSSGTITWVAYQKPLTVVASGSCGADLVWTFYSDGSLRISGQGEMDNYENGSARSGGGQSGAQGGMDDFENCGPWEEFCGEITSVELDEGVTSIGNNAFCCCHALRSVNLPESLTRIGQFAFHECSQLEAVKLPAGIRTLEELRIC